MSKNYTVYKWHGFDAMRSTRSDYAFAVVYPISKEWYERIMTKRDYIQNRNRVFHTHFNYFHIVAVTTTLDRANARLNALQSRYRGDLEIIELTK